ncbi:MAG: hypothetical protein BWK79_17845 [Beggiatoa sp. IS2]|nr:MAG: hypothetical protein BWK79_17845 [Beggiatoa sp. IS2]
MKTKIHLLAGLIATLTIATFLISTLLVELFGDHATIAQIKSLIVMPGLFILIPALAITGATGFSLSQSRTGRLVENKKRRMPLIAANGILILLPAAIMLNLWAAAGVFDTYFYVVQTIELIAGPINLILMGLNIRDGWKLTGRFGTKRQEVTS